jgi:hypothetical protein
VLIKYTGHAGRRIVGALEWNRENEFIQTVDEPELACELLSHPPNDFSVAEEEPLLTIVNEDVVGLLALYGIASASQLAAIVDKEVQAAFAGELGSTLEELRGWIKSAAKLVA